MTPTALAVLTLWISTFTVLIPGGSGSMFPSSKYDLLSVDVFHDTEDNNVPFASIGRSYPKGSDSKLEIRRVKNYIPYYVQKGSSLGTNSSLRDLQYTTFKNRRSGRGVGNRDLFGATIDQGQIGRLQRRRRALLGSQHTHKNSKVTEGSQINPIEFSSLGHGNDNKKKYKKSQDLRKQSHKDVGITQRRRGIFGFGKKHKEKNEKICSENETDAVTGVPETRRNIQDSLKNIDALVKSIEIRAENAGNVTAGNETKPENATAGNQTKPEIATAGNETKPENATAGNQTKPENATAGNETKPENATVGNKTTADNATTGNETKSENATAGNETKAESRSENVTKADNATAGNEMKPENATAGNETKPENATAGNVTTANNATAGNETKPENATAGNETKAENRSENATKAENSTAGNDTKPENATAGNETKPENATAGNGTTANNATAGNGTTANNATAGNGTTANNATAGNETTAQNATTASDTTTESDKKTRRMNQKVRINLQNMNHKRHKDVQRIDKKVNDRLIEIRKLLLARTKKKKGKRNPQNLNTGDKKGSSQGNKKGEKITGQKNTKGSLTVAQNIKMPSEGIVQSDDEEVNNDLPGGHMYPSLKNNSTKEAQLKNNNSSNIARRSMRAHKEEFAEYGQVIPSEYLNKPLKYPLYSYPFQG